MGESSRGPGRTGGLRFEHPMRVRHREFSGQGDWLELALDPSGRVSGRFQRNGVVVPHSPTAATLIELTHRLTSGAALLLVVGLFMWCRRALPKRQC